MVLEFLSEDERKLVFPYLKEIHLKKGEALFRPQTASDGVYFLAEGRLGVQTETGFEEKMQVVALLDPGAPVGEKGITDEGSRGMSVVAIEESKLFLLHRNDFHILEKSEPNLAMKILKRLLSISSLRLLNSSIRLAHVL